MASVVGMPWTGARRLAGQAALAGPGGCLEQARQADGATLGSPQAWRRATRSRPPPRLSFSHKAASVSAQQAVPTMASGKPRAGIRGSLCRAHKANQTCTEAGRTHRASLGSGVLRGPPINVFARDSGKDPAKQRDPFYKNISSPGLPVLRSSPWGRSDKGEQASDISGSGKHPQLACLGLVPFHWAADAGMQGLPATSLSPPTGSFPVPRGPQVWGRA